MWFSFYISLYVVISNIWNFSFNTLYTLMSAEKKIKAEVAKEYQVLMDILEVKGKAEVGRILKRQYPARTLEEIEMALVSLQEDLDKDNIKLN
jgi:hypothetical protein